MDDWFELTVETSTEAVEAVANFLVEAGAAGIQIDDAADFQQATQSAEGVWFDPKTIPHRQSGAAVSGYFPSRLHPTELMTRLQAEVDRLPSYGLAKGTGHISVANIAQADWANAWKKYYHPLRLTRFLTIVPAWLDYTPQQAGELVMKLDPDMAFGTGSHPTTALMLRLLEALVRGGETMIDVGTGSGVLAIAARLLGVKAVLATDVDAAAVANAEANLALNPVDHIDVIANDLLQGIDTQADLVVANILANVLTPLIPQVKHNLKPHGRFLLSGIYEDKATAIKQVLAGNGFKVRSQWQQGDWVALVAGWAKEEDQ